MENKRIPSQEKPWLKWYVENAWEKAHEPYENVTMYQYLSRKLREDGDKYDALNYFGTRISRSKMLSEIDRWARTFCGMGIKENDRVIVFIPFTPEAAYILFALNKIGAWPVMLNLGSSAEAIKSGCVDSKFAIVSDAVEDRIAHVLRNNPSFQNVILLNVGTDMPLVMRNLYKLKNGKIQKNILKEAKNYISSKNALARWSGFSGETEAPCDIKRPAIITSTSGTSKAGYAKQILDSNAAVVSMIKQLGLTSLPPRCKPGDICYTGLPPFISTSVLVLFLLPLFYNLTCYIDPRMEAEVFTKNLLKYRPQLCLITGRCWVYFFTQIERMIKKGKTPDLSFLRIPIMGGDGIVVKDLKWMNGLLKQCGAEYGICSGYGMSEMFSLLSADTRYGFAANNDTEPVISVGAPMPGSEVAIMDENCNELGYGERGEVCARGMTLMEGYYNDPEKTREAIRDGWYHSGDLGSIDEDGNIYVYGRMSSCYTDAEGHKLQPFDLENFVAQDPEVHYCMVNNMAPDGQKPRLAMHLVLLHECKDTAAVIRRIDKSVKDFLEYGQIVEGYKLHRHIFKMNAVLKLDRRYYKEQFTGYIRPEGDKMVEVSFE